MSLPDYYSRFNPDLLALIPPDAKVVLEIGCGAGALCEAYRRVNPGVKWLGVESNPEASESAKTHGIDVIQKDVEGDAYADDDREITISFTHTKEMYRKEIDCLVFGDVLEHLRDPWAVMKRLAGFLRPGAQVLASIPNVQHWTVIRDLLAGKWEYQDEGLLDRTHLRFFTLDSIRKMFDQAGLHIHEIRGRDLCNEGHREFADAIMSADDHLGKNVFDLLGLNEAEWERCTRAYQYIVRAVKPVMNREIWASEHQHFDSDKFETKVWESPKPIAKLHIHAVTAEECCARPRIHEPFAAMRTVPGVTCTTSNGIIPVAASVVILQRARKMRYDYGSLAEDAILIAELDDEPEAIGVDPMALRAVHAVQVSTEPLAEIVRQYNPNVMVFPNQIAELPPLKSPAIGQHEIELVYAAQNRESDWAPIMDSLNTVLRDHPLVEVRVVHDRKFYDALETDNKKFSPFLSYADYRMRLGQASIALLPLEPGGFNKCKSDIKFLECAAEGVAVLASQTVYRDLLVESLGYLGRFSRGWTYESEARFESLLRHAITSPEHRRELATNAYAYVRDNRMLGQHFRKRLAWYRDLLSSKGDLTRQLLERVPELRSPQHAPTDSVSSLR